MKLTLKLASAPQHAGETRAGQSRTLTEGRLCIGRGTDNDWVLADPDRTLSKNHCRIDASESGFMLTDLSTNGVFLAGQGQAIGRGHSCALEDGDSFSLGPYTLAASIEGGDTGALQLEQGLGLPREDEEAFFPASNQPRADLLSPIAPAIAEPWLTGIPGGAFGPSRRAAPQGWDAPPDPAAYAASGTLAATGSENFVSRNPLDPRLPGPLAPEDGFSQSSEHLAAASTVMRVPQPQVVLPMDWNEVPASEPVHAAPAAEAPPAAAWPPALPLEPEPPKPAELPPSWLAKAPDDSWGAPAPPAALPESWSAPVAAPGSATPAVPVPPPEPAPQARVAPPPETAEAAPVVAGEAAEALIAAFLEGAGLQPDTLRGADAAASFREIGQLVRAAVDGARDILATRALVKSEFRVDQTVLRRNDNNAMKFAPDAERCLAAMVGTAPPGFLPGHEAMRQSMEDIKRHELALVAAINKVFADLGRQLDPELIMAKARQETGLGTMLPYAKEVRCWTIYTETHALLQDSGAADTGGSLLAPVAQAYDRQLRRG